MQVYDKLADYNAKQHDIEIVVGMLKLSNF
jgi:hypothetical protein